MKWLRAQSIEQRMMGSTEFQAPAFAEAASRRQAK